MDWDPLLDYLAEIPRENGTRAVHETARRLAETLRAAGVEAVETIAFVAQPWRLRLLGVLILLGTLFYWYSMRRRRPATALLLAIALPAVVLAELPRGLVLRQRKDTEGSFSGDGFLEVIAGP